MTGDACWIIFCPVEGFSILLSSLPHLFLQVSTAWRVLSYLYHVLPILLGMFQELGRRKTAYPVHQATGAKQVGVWDNSEGREWDFLCAYPWLFKLTLVYQTLRFGSVLAMGRGVCDSGVKASLQIALCSTCQKRDFNCLCFLNCGCRSYSYIQWFRKDPGRIQKKKRCCNHSEEVAP